MAKGVSIDLIVDPKRAIAGIGQVESKASGASDMLGRLGRVAGGALLGLSAAAAAGAVALGSAVVKSFSEYEQLAGGVTKLFGDADKTVSKFAQNAATSAGLSTNAYLNTVTSFSASLITGLKGDQEAAARIADQAVTDMADNANTFGTSIDSLQLAYQGFAKGNFTLLDNLKLGFGGSQQGMADLINSSGVLGSSMKVTAQNVKDVPFDKMIEAIHKVQQGMGIAGTTAREAASTIQGSFDATKASISNLVTGLGMADADFDTLVGNVTKNAQNLISNVAPVFGRLAEAVPQIAPVLISAVEKVVPLLIPMASSLITSILDGIVKGTPALIKGAVPIILNLVTGIVTMLPAILDAGIKVIISLVDGISAALPKLIPAAVKAIRGLLDALLSNVPVLISAGLQMVTALAKGLIAAIPKLIPAAVTAIVTLATSLIGMLPTLLDVALQLIVALAQGLVAAIPQLVAALPGIIISITDFLVGAIPQLIDAGITLLISLVGALPVIITGIVAAIPKIITSLVVAVIGAIPQLIAAGVKLLIALVENTPMIIFEIIKAVPQIVTGIFNAFTDPKMVAQLAKAGGQLIVGLWNGIKDLGAWLWSKVSGFFGGLIDNIKALFGIHSPSTVFAGFGDNMIAGLVGGIKGGYGLVTNTMGDLSDKVSDGFRSSLAVDARATVTASGGAALASGGGQVVIHVDGGLDSGVEIGRRVAEALQSYRAAGGRVAF